MLKPKKKITKREIKEDTLVTTYFEAQTWFEANRKRLSTVFTAVLVAGVAVWFYWNNLTAQNQAATADLGKILRYYDQGAYETAINGSPRENIRGLRQIVDEYGGTTSGDLAAFYLANSYFARGDYARALEYYEQADVSDPSIEASVTAGIAACLEAEGKHLEAAQAYEKAARNERLKVLAPEYLSRAGHCYLQAGEKEKAAEVLRTLKTSHPTSPFAREADRLLVRATS